MPRHHLDGLPVESLRRAGRTLSMPQADRERTPRLFAEFLVRLASRCYVGQAKAVTPNQAEQLRRPGEIETTSKLRSSAKQARISPPF
jgi:hypothetical protein